VPVNRFTDLEQAQASVDAKVAQAGAVWLPYEIPPNGAIRFIGRNLDGTTKFEFQEHQFVQNNDESWSIIEGEIVSGIPSS
jgi:hypothetical protein